MEVWGVHRSFGVYVEALGCTWRFRVCVEVWGLCGGLGSVWRFGVCVEVEGVCEGFGVYVKV